jgi:hypothetical protein
MTVRYRLYQQGDLPQLEKLWQGSTEWGSLTPALLSRHVENAPFGRPIIAVVESIEDGNILGQTVLMPSRITVRGQHVTAFRPLAPILARSLRAPSFDPIQHPILQLHRYALQELHARGEQLLFMVPDPRWMVLIRMLPGFMHASFPLWSLPVPLASKFELAAGYTWAPLIDWNWRVDKLFAKAAEQFACMIVRDSPALFKKAGPPDYHVLGIERSGELVGVVASKAKGDRQWLIYDLLAADPDAETAALQAACNFAHARAIEAAASAAAIRKVAILALPRSRLSLEKLGFRRDKYDFHLVVKVMAGSLSSADVHPSLWYLSAND